ncbi:MAG: hypothetical protein HY875_13890 [Chloroflexi bacterium]|nr:hypothetical protein [Chloroflexota bacterium]
MRDYLSQQGLDLSAFDVLIVLDLDPLSPAGGWAYLGGDFVAVGWYFEGGAGTIDQYRSDAFAATAFQHEMAHTWAWEHEWTYRETEARTGNIDLFITEPALFGWIDQDGDSIPEILDATPYGMTRLFVPHTSRGQ